MNKTTLTFLESVQVANVLQDLHKNPSMQSCGRAKLGEAVNLKLLDLQYNATRLPSALSVWKLAKDLKLAEYFRAIAPKGQQVRSNAKLLHRIAALEEMHLNLLERLAICERKWLQHLQEQSTEKRSTQERSTGHLSDSCMR